MAICKFQVTLKTRDGDPANFVVNTFHADITNASLAAGCGLFATRLIAFYHDTPATGTNPVKAFLGNRLSATGHEIRAYNLADAKPRVPIIIATFDFTTMGAACLPEELAVVLSFEADKVAGAPQNRRRNRVYLGPLTSNAVDQEGSPGFRPKVAQTFIDNLTKAAHDLKAGNTATEKWMVYSPTNGTTHDIRGGWVDDAPDTQRRRGSKAINRTTWT